LALEQIYDDKHTSQKKHINTHLHKHTIWMKVINYDCTIR